MSTGETPRTQSQKRGGWGCGTSLAIAIVVIVFILIKGSGGGAFTTGHIGGSCPASPINVGDEYILRPQVFNGSGKDWPHTYINFSAGGFVVNAVGDDTGGSATSLVNGIYQLRGVRPHQSMTATLILVAKQAGNFNISGFAFGGTSNDGQLPDNPLGFGCKVTVDP